MPFGMRVATALLRGAKDSYVEGGGITTDGRRHPSRHRGGVAPVRSYLMRALCRASMWSRVIHIGASS